MNRCWLLGHEADPVGSEYGYDQCVRCGFPDDLPVAELRLYHRLAEDGAKATELRFYGVVPSVRGLWLRFAWWLGSLWRQTATCRICGEREGWGHSPDCMPF